MINGQIQAVSNSIDKELAIFPHRYDGLFTVLHKAAASGEDGRNECLRLIAGASKQHLNKVLALWDSNGSRRTLLHIMLKHQDDDVIFQLLQKADPRIIEAALIQAYNSWGNWGWETKTGFKLALKKLNYDCILFLFKILSPFVIGDTNHKVLNSIQFNRKLNAEDRAALTTIHKQIDDFINHPLETIRDNPNDFLTFISNHLHKDLKNIYAHQSWIDLIIKILTTLGDSEANLKIRDQLLAFLGRACFAKYHYTKPQKDEDFVNTYKAWASISNPEHIDAWDSDLIGTSFGQVLPANVARQLTYLDENRCQMIRLQHLQRAAEEFEPSAELLKNMIADEHQPAAFYAADAVESKRVLPARINLPKKDPASVPASLAVDSKSQDNKTARYQHTFFTLQQKSLHYEHKKTKKYCLDKYRQHLHELKQYLDERRGETNCLLSLFGHYTSSDYELRFAVYEKLMIDPIRGDIDLHENLRIIDQALTSKINSGRRKDCAKFLLKLREDLLLGLQLGIHLGEMEAGGSLMSRLLFNKF